jgi:large subunit ribosomal protein L9
MARVKVVLREDVPKLGAIGEIVSVAGGYARNFLIPRGLAVPATKGNVKQAETWRESKSARAANAVREAEGVRVRLEAQPLEVKAQAGPDGRLFGSITAAQVAEAIKESLDIDLDRHEVQLADPIRHLGFHEVEIRLHAEVMAKVTVEAVEG